MRGPSGSILVICTANVCRSPLAERILQLGLERAGLDEVAVSSAGVRANEGDVMCGVSATYVPPGARRAEDHRSREITSDAIASAQLVLTMERAHRSMVARLLPGSQSRVFTLREAAALLPIAADRRVAPVRTLAEAAAALHASRGLAPSLVPTEPPRRWWRLPVEPSDPLTILDGHGFRDQQHREALVEVGATTAAAVEGLVALVATPR